MFICVSFLQTTQLNLKLMFNLITFSVICSFFKNYKFFLNLIFILHNNFSFLLKNLIFFSYLSKTFFKGIEKLLLFLYYIKFPSFKVFKAYGINMRIIRLNKRKHRYNILFLRLGYSHGFCVKISRLFFFRVFKRRYFLISGFNFIEFSNLIYSLRYFRKFFQYKLIGIKLLRDNFKIKVGKKKTF